MQVSLHVSQRITISQPQEILNSTPLEHTLHINTEYYFKILYCFTNLFVFILALWVSPHPPPKLLSNLFFLVSPHMKIIQSALPQLEWKWKGKPSHNG